MNERARWRHRKVLYSFLLMVVCGIGVVFSYLKLASWARSYYQVDSVVVVGPAVDEETVANISSWLTVLLQRGVLAKPQYDALTKSLLADFPLIGSVSWSRYKPSCLRCAVAPVKPVAIINDFYVAGDNGCLYEIGLFDSVPPTLPAFVVNNAWLSSELFSRVLSFFNAIPLALLSGYNVVYHDPYRIVMTPKNELDLPYRCVCIVDERSVTLVPDLVRLMSMCQHAQEQIMLFDFRFSGSVITKCITHKEYLQLQRV